MEKRDNYAVASANARKLFLSYDQDALIRKLNLRYDDAWLYTRFFDRDYRISRLTGNVERLEGADWQSANGFHEVPRIISNPALQPFPGRFSRGK